MKRKQTVFTIIIFIALMGICGNAGALSDRDAVNTAVSAAETWLELIDEGEYSDSYTRAGELFKNYMPEKEWIRNVHAVRNPLGKIISRSTLSVELARGLPGAPDGKYVLIQFRSSFEKKMEAVETVTMAEEKGQWRAVGYFIN